MRGKYKAIRQSYIDGLSIDDICLAHKISRATFYYYKNKDKDSWEELRLANSRADIDIKDKESMFLNQLIASWEEFIKNKTLDLKTLEALNKYARSYWRIKSPSKLNQREITLKVAKQTIKNIADFALSKKDRAVADFLSNNADEIISSVLNKNS